jgi:hypothetical protein
MKIDNLRRKIIFNFIISAIAVAACAVASYLYLGNKAVTADMVNKINKESKAIERQITEIKNHSSAIDKHKLAWGKLSKDQKSVEGIEVKKFNKTLTNLSKKYLITTKKVNINLPAQLDNKPFDRKTVDMFFTSVSIDFMAINDTLAMAFVNDLTKSLHGYIVITSFSIKKSKDYSEQDLIDLTLEKNPGILEGKLDFAWYAPKESSKSLF